MLERVPESDLVESLPQHWLDSEHVTCGAKLLEVDGNPSGNLRGTAFSKLNAPNGLSSRSPILPEPDRDAYLRRLEMLTPVTLRALSTLPDNLLGPLWLPHRPYWQQAAARHKRDGDISPVTGAKLIADRLRAGVLSGPQLVSVAHHELGVNWQGSPGLYHALNSLIKSLSAKVQTKPGDIAGMKTFSDVAAMKKFRQLHQLPRWELIENALLQQMLYWPLLILGRGTEFSLPVAIDVAFDFQSKAHFESNDLIDYTNWQRPLANALSAAKELWKAKHGSWPKEFQTKIEGASVTVDLRIAERIAKPFHKIEPTGSSAEAYFALAILANFLGSSTLHTTCATGKLGRRLGDREGGADHKIEAMDGDILKLKFKRAQDALFFDTLVTPLSPEISTQKHLRVCKGEQLSDFATHARLKWRKNQFVRAPDLDIAFRSPDRTKRYGFKVRYIENPEDEVEYVLRELRRNRSNAVLELARPVRAEAVARALYRVRSESTRKYHRTAKANTGAFAFIRAVPNEINDRFWRQVWELVEGSGESFFEFRFRTSRYAAGATLATQLNKFNPTPEDPGRAPDILVIVGSDHIDKASRHIENGPFARLQLQSLKSILERRLLPTPVVGIQEQVGRTRVILVPNDSYEQEQEGMPLEELQRHIDAELCETIRALSIFRYGFTYEMARNMLGIDDQLCERLLARLQDTDGTIDGQKCLTLATGSHEYMLHIRSDLSEERRQLGHHHFLAANSIVGFLMPDAEIVRLNFREALSPVWLHEAQFHLQQAIRLGHTPAKVAAERLSRIGELFGWTRVRWAAERSDEDGLELLETLRTHLRRIEAKKDRIKYQHPVEFVLAAKFTHELARRMQKDGRLCGRGLIDLRLERSKYLRLADQACANFIGRAVNEGEACRYIVATSRAVMTMEDSPNGDGLSTAADDIKTANSLKIYEGELLYREWFEYMGDRDWDDYTAAAEYANAIVNQNLPRQRPAFSVIIKYLGAASAAGHIPSDEVLTTIMSARDTLRIRLPSTAGGGLHQLHKAQKRWRDGKRIFLDRNFAFLARPVQ